MSTDQLFQGVTEFTPDVIQYLRDVRKDAQSKAEKSLDAHHYWLSRVDQWGAILRQAEANAQPQAQAWQQGDPSVEEVAS